MSAEQKVNQELADLIPAVEALSSAVHAGNRGAFETALDNMASIRERNLFQEIGKLTRQLHEALQVTDADSRIADMARREFPDARGRLDQVIAMMDKSAHRTMDLVEEGVPLLDQVIKDNNSLEKRWKRFRRKELCGDEFRALVDDLSAFFDQTVARGEFLRRAFNEVLMAQDFQDLCGQEIRKVMHMVQDVEHTLIDMIRAPGNDETGGRADKSTNPNTAMEGQKLGQDEADEILSSLGF